MAKTAKKPTRPARSKSTKTRPKAASASLKILQGGGFTAKQPQPVLGLAVIERREGKGWVIRVGTGSRIAVLADGVEEAFVEECMRDQRTVMITDDGGPAPAVIVGALQTARTVARDNHDTLVLNAKRIEVGAEQEITLRAGKSLIRIDKNGQMRLRGQKMAIDVATVVRIMSALVELP